MIPLERLAVEANLVVHPSAAMRDVVTGMGRVDALTALVVDERGAIGILTQRDIVRLMAGDFDWHSCRVDQVMTAPVVTVPADMSCHAAYHLMLEKGVRHLVIDRDPAGLFRVIGEKSFLDNGNLRDDTASPRVASIMQCRPLTLPLDASMRDAVSLMSRERSDYVIVAHHDRPLGIVTERDVFRKTGALVDHPDACIDTVMSTPVLTIQPDAPLNTALEQMQTYGVRRLVVVGLDSRILGLVSLHQLIADRQRRYLAVLQANLQDCEEQQFPGQLLDVVGDGVVIIESATGLIVKTNPQLSDWLGYHETDMSGMALSDIAPEPAHQARWIHDDPTAPGDRVFRACLRARDGRDINAEISSKQVVFNGQSLIVSVVRDLTQREAAAAALRASEQRQRLVAKVFENSNEGVVITDGIARIVEVNPAFSLITGYAPHEVIGKTPNVLSSGRHDATFYQVMWRQLREAGAWRGEIWNRRKNGEVYPEWLSIAAVRDEAGQVQHYVAIFSDISEQHRSRQEIEYLAHHDALTDLPNRLLFNARLDHAISQARRSKRQLAVLFVDLDRFKTINDSLGHALGDEVLRRVAERMRLAMRGEDTMARLGGDEFIILLENITAAGACEVAEKLATALGKPLQLKDEPVYISLSIGISLYPRDGGDVDTLVRNADAAMYKAKSSGRDNFQFYTPELTDEVLEQAFLQNHLRRAIEQQEFRLFYQPQVDIETGRATGVEALLRWQHPSEGLIMPMRFIPLLEEQGLMRQVGPWVLRRACEDYLRWQQAGIAPRSIAVNLSGAQIQAQGAVEQIERILAETGMPPEHLELEVTETFVMDDPESNINTLHRLRALGIRLAIDDFGTGYSSLAYLKRLPIKKLKIDRSFVKDVPGDADDEAITRAVIGLGKTLNLDIIAEGVERKACVDFLLREGCYFGQGYLWGKPMPEDEIVPWLAQHTRP